MRLARKIVSMDLEEADENIINCIFEIHQKSTILKSQPSFILIKGKSGAGRKLYSQDLASFTKNKLTNVVNNSTSIINVSMSAPFSAARFYKKLLTELNVNAAPLNDNKSLIQLTIYCHSMLKNRGVKVLFIDDFDLLQVDREKQLAIDLINKISKELNITVVFLRDDEVFN